MPYVVNPHERGGRRPVDLITDRAKRYRAHGAIEQREKVCIYCGKRPKRADVEHIDGDERNNNPANLAWSCRSCNAAKAHHQKAIGAGRRTRQFNPRGRRRGGGAGARSLAAFIKAIKTVKGEGAPQMDYAAAVELLHNTPPNLRTTFAKEGAARAAQQRKLFADEVPF